MSAWRHAAQFEDVETWTPIRIRSFIITAVDVVKVKINISGILALNAGKRID